LVQEFGQSIGFGQQHRAGREIRGIGGDILPGLEEFIESRREALVVRIIEDQLNLRERFVRCSELPHPLVGTQQLLFYKAIDGAADFSGRDAGSDLTRLTIFGQAFAEGDLLPGVARGADVGDILASDGQGALEGGQRIGTDAE